MKKLLAIIMVLALSAGLNSCKKYDDGPLISFRSKKARVINDWVIDKVMSKGVDVTSNYPEDYMLSIKEDGSFTLTSNGLSFDGKWKFSDDKTQLIITPDVTGIDEIYLIKRLKNKEFTYDQTVNKETSTFYMVQKP